jgi:hypothetical protein
MKEENYFVFISADDGETKVVSYKSWLEQKSVRTNSAQSSTDRETKVVSCRQDNGLMDR